MVQAQRHTYSSFKSKCLVAFEVHGGAGLSILQQGNATSSYNVNQRGFPLYTRVSISMRTKAEKNKTKQGTLRLSHLTTYFKSHCLIWKAKVKQLAMLVLS
jgi:hypothetical protein